MVAGEPPLRVERRSGTIVLTGEIDAYTEAQVRDALTLAPDPGDLRVDFSGVSFIDSSGLRIVLEVHHKLAREGRRLVIVAPAKGVARLIEIAGLVSHLHVELRLETVDAPQSATAADR